MLFFELSHLNKSLAKFTINKKSKLDKRTTWQQLQFNNALSYYRLKYHRLANIVVQWNHGLVSKYFCALILSILPFNVYTIVYLQMNRVNLVVKFYLIVITIVQSFMPLLLGKGLVEINRRLYESISYYRKIMFWCQSPPSPLPLPSLSIMSLHDWKSAIFLELLSNGNRRLFTVNMFGKFTNHSLVKVSKILFDKDHNC